MATAETAADTSEVGTKPRLPELPDPALFWRWVGRATRPVWVRNIGRLPCSPHTSHRYQRWDGCALSSPLPGGERWGAWRGE